MSEEHIEPRVVTPGTFNIMKASQFTGKLKFIGGQDIGPKITVELLNVVFRPANNAMGVISDEWGQLQVTGECLLDVASSGFGTILHPDTTAVAPLTSNYYVGKGVVSIQILTGITPPDAAYRDLGNCPLFEFVPNITLLTHYSSRVGVRTKDLEIIHEKQATVNLRLDEWSYQNLQLAFLGAP